MVLLYNVYVITLENGEKYVGCTNNITRRKTQHNENVRKKKNRFAQYVADKYPDKIFVDSDLLVIATFQDRSEALKYERKTAKSYIGKYVLLNDNYSDSCTRKGKNLGNTSKDYVLVDFVEHTSEFLSCLRGYCKSRGWSASLLNKTIHGNCVSYGRYKLFYSDVWQDMDEEKKEYYLSGKFIIEHQENLKKLKQRNYSKKYLVKTPSGNIEEVVNLSKYAREHNLTEGTLHATLIKKKPTKGYMVMERIEQDETI